MNYDEIINIVKKTKSIITDENLRNTIKIKGEADFVTGVDIAISSFIKKELNKIDNTIGFMSEEEKVEAFPSERWILDPIDGTTNMIFNYQLSSVSLALMKNNEIVFGVVYNPYNDELFTAEKNKGAFLNGEKINCVDREPLNSLIEFGAGSTRKEDAKNIFEFAESIFEECLDVRRICSSALSICYIAAGRLNGYFEKKIKPWDYAAASLILAEAGGKIIQWDENELQFDNPAGVICGSNKTFEFILAKKHRFYN